MEPMRLSTRICFSLMLVLVGIAAYEAATIPALPPIPWTPENTDAAIAVMKTAIDHQANGIVAMFGMVVVEILTAINIKFNENP